MDICELPSCLDSEHYRMPMSSTVVLRLVHTLDIIVCLCHVLHCPNSEHYCMSLSSCELTSCLESCTLSYMHMAVLSCK